MEELFYITADKITESNITVSGDDFHHIIRVMRIGLNEEVFFTDGVGKFYRTKISQIRKHDFEAEILNVNDKNFPLSKKINVFVGILKNKDRLEWIVEKSGEMSVNSLTPINTDHTVKTHLNLERLQKIAVSALKQSKNAHLLQINEIAELTKRFNQKSDHLNLILHEKQLPESKYLLELSFERFSEINLFIGPEGGFSEREIGHFSENNFQFIWFGDQRLRTETAAITAVGILNQLLQNK